DMDESYVVRLGDDIPVHQVMRFNELAASKAAAAAGISPEVVHHEPGVLVIRFVEGKVYEEADVRSPENLARTLQLVKKVHEKVTQELRGPSLVFWVFHVLRDYGHSLVDGNSTHLDKLPRLMDIAQKLEQAVGPVELCYCHNDLLPANFIDDGERLWLIDWDYGGFNSPLFDLANLASNNQLSNEQERWLLAEYDGAPPDRQRWRSYSAMKCASLLRETLWSMVSEIHSELDFDYGAYTAENLDRFETTLNALKKDIGTL
ncbi:MAG: choline kinase family protein, partial [Kiloniellales bacterium]|nr:choline kinase family protein [Kiloniellales bacterium]